ncbi:MAG: type II/IV secretion system protein [Candidatus Levybacteria bacterium]|nr:type II/IV secretion system protein [Candidatus Levybacteria bacterium]MBI3070394.1 type II/IV secretion system protein [Candidatus Levybacteria bacterium]MBI3092682.1 type II/IV secretion system protein [Candidatus Levybacteria bacterium]
MPNNDVSPVASVQTVADILLSEHLLNQEQYEDVKVKSASEGKSIERIIESENLVAPDKLAEAKAKLLGIPFISLANASFSPEALSFVPRSVAERFSLVPFLYDEKSKTLSLAMGNPVDLEALSFLQQKTGLSIKAFAASLPEVIKAISTQYRQELITEVGAALKETEELKKIKTVDSAQIAQIIKEAPIAKIVSTILEYAVTSRASDVHIEPQEDRVRVRYRIDGILYDRLSLPKTVQEAVISRIKILSEMKIDEHRTPQDGRFNFKAGEDEVDLRISVLPAAHGEKVVMRLLRKSGGIPTLPELGLSGTALKNLETAILRPHGIIIVCGPTGSGKTTTLYSVLSKLNTTRVNIMSLEDPVEYQIAGVNQVQINPAVGLTFATGLRAFLRQDPNIILVGEIRDQETTDLAIQAALTGHLVFSTLHTSNAAGALPRLLDLGAEPFLLASTMNAMVGQRIARKICSHCKEAYLPPVSLISEMKEILGNLFPKAEAEVKLYKGKGCSECGDSGYLGRIGIFEVLPVSEKIAHLVLEHPDSATIEKQAISEGMITMKQDGYLKVLQGVTTIEEILRVAQE